jgi:HAD superfamily hydrolase (TIGR01484 family)
VSSRIQLISTDFDGTIFAEFEDTPISRHLQEVIGRLQAGGAKWVINTGRDLSSLLEALGRAHIPIRPDYLVLVEREIRIHDGIRYASVDDWNTECTRSHEELFARIRPDMPRLVDWITQRFKATVYEDAYSPFCLITESPADADAIQEHLDAYCREVPNLTVMRNDVYARFSHVAYHKGTALAEIARRLKIRPENIFAAGDHWNDLPMLSRAYAHHLAAPDNAIPAVKTLVREQQGYLSRLSHGDGVADALEFYLRK